MVDIPESLPDVSCVRRRDMPLPSHALPSRSDTPTYASSSGGPSAALCTPSSSAALGAPPSGGTSILTRCYVSLCASPPADSCRPVLTPGHLPHTDGSLRSPPPIASRSPTPPPQVVSPPYSES